MKPLRYTLITDGSSDFSLIPILNWLLKSNGIQSPLDSYWADLRRYPGLPKSLSEKIKKSIDFYPCELLFIHRDAEKLSLAQRCQEINAAIDIIGTDTILPRNICIIPIRMTEAWLLIDEDAIRRAAGNGSGTQPLDLPKLNKIEKIADPKKMLFDLLKNASGLKGHRLKKLRVHLLAQNVSKYINDFSPLRKLYAFSKLEQEIINFIENL